jgi:hypothetical protein
MDEIVIDISGDTTGLLWGSHEMEKIIELYETTPPSTDDQTRTELMWEDREELLVEKWRVDIMKASHQHQRLGKKYQNLYKIFGLPTVLIPLSLSGLNGVLEVEPLVVTILLVLSASLQGVVTFVNFGQKYQEHYNYSTLYSELSKQIECELCKPKSKRLACDVFLERVRQQYSHLNHMAPV